MPGIDANTVLCLHCDGVDGSASFPDGSQYGHPATSNWNAQVSTAQSKFGGASLLCDGVGDQLSVPDHTDFRFGSGNFTIDFWVRFNSLATPGITLIGKGSAWSIYLGGGGQVQWFCAQNTTWDLINGAVIGTPTVNTWYHVAVARWSDGTNTYWGLFWNGTLVAAPGSVGIPPLFADTNPVVIGAPPFNGWMDEVRISKGVARWTTNFTLPTESYAPAYTDAPSGGIVHGPVGGIDTYTVLCLHTDGANASTSFPDASQYAHNATAFGNAQILTSQSKFGGAAAFFDGAGDYLTIPHSTDFDLGSGDFTIDLWLWVSSLSGAHRIIGKGTGAFWPFLIYQNGAQLQFWSSSNGTSWDILAGMTITLSLTGGWHHVAVTRQGSTWRTFYDGTLAASATTAATVMADTNPVRIGAGSVTGEDYGGWLEEIRISKGIARWTSNFVPPTSPYAVIYTGAQTGVTRAFAPSGGIALGGSASSTRIKAITASGGIVFGGTCSSTRIAPVALTARLYSGATLIASWTHPLTGTRARVSWARFQAPVAPGGALVTFGKARLVLAAKQLSFAATAGVTVGKARLVLRGKSYTVTLPTRVQPLKPRLLLRGKAYTLRQTQSYPIGKPRLILRAKPIARAGQPGLVPAVPLSLTLTPTASRSGILVPTVPKSTLLVPTVKRAI